MSNLKKFYATAERQTTPQFLVATVAEVNNSSGIRLLFDGTSTATTKYYKCAAGLTLAVGDRVKLVKYSGTYVIEYKIGLPGEIRTTMPFYINSTEYSCYEGDTPYEWLSTALNTDGYTIISGGNYGGYFFSSNGTTKTAVVGANYTTAIINGQRYGLDYIHFSIAGVQQNMYKTGVTASNWIESDLNTSGYTLAKDGNYYYFYLNGTKVGFVGNSVAHVLIEGYNYHV